MPTTDEVIETCSSDEVSLVRLLYVGNDGVPRGRVVDADRVASVLTDGINLSSAMQSFNALDHLAPGGMFGAAGEVRILPDPETFRILPYANRAAVMLCDLYDLDRTPWAADPRSTLASYLDDLPYEASVAFESEFYLTRDTEDGELAPFDDSVCFAADGMQSTNDIVLDMTDALKAQGMDIVAYYPEYGPGQQELVVEHAPGLQAADNHILFKQTVKGVASNHGVDATFVPKPFAEAAGAGCHIHLSLWDDGENVFHDPDSDGQYGLSETARHFIGGVLDHAPALVALTAATVSSYRRLRPHMWASAFTCWGQDNREAIVRVPSSQWDEPSETTRFEFKPADNTANPYLAELGLLAAGMDGVERELDPGAPVNEDPAEMSAAEREERGVQRLPETLGEALDELEADEVLAAAMGETLFQSYVEVKRSQWDEFTGTVTEWELDKFTRAF
ncbi:glutamine synthetase [Halorarum halophilum]|uniref:Glutamine synthetase n=1 Tax=Halorarum halophilum TaxID=2743090 RepID=A0A7D5K7D7_9EURY|nr:gamma-glutamylputrescine synthetase [Halobaculum halophilum]QLG27419.1 glutamine synthetase [Halobaculum halophilum]